MRLLLSAFAPELGSLAKETPPGWEIATVGVGAVSAAAATTALVVDRWPEAVVFLGTCGRYDRRLSLFDCLWATEAIATSLEELRGGAYRPKIERSRWPALLPGALPGHAVVVPPAITCTAEGAALLGNLGPVEHLELTGVFEACRLTGVPCGAALVVVNEVGPDAQAQWTANHEEGSRRLVERLMASGLFAGA
ncbi:MAG: phosphorylase [Holophagaceae bacterium]|uniref:Phosphorylase n=1 Tax=Candidatus Geothrix skivensis TaxID=2954439 RepID=A0A9D7XH14_9BACT|nr:phosphorylase [Candidatus Geothrix skivensis]